MTDKQIIIDGVDVSGCVHFIQEEKDCCDLGGNCKGWANCYYKQLKRKEQECEELKGIRDSNFLHALEEQKRADKLSKTLTEIKEIAETASKCLYATISDDYTDGYRWLGSIILQKISECEANQ